MMLRKSEFVLKHNLPKWALNHKPWGALALEFDDFPWRILGVIQWGGAIASSVVKQLRGGQYMDVPMYYLTFVPEKVFSHDEVNYQSNEPLDFVMKQGSMRVTTTGIKYVYKPYWNVYNKKRYNLTGSVLGVSVGSQQLTSEMIDLGNRMDQCIQMVDGLLIDPVLAYQFEWTNRDELVRRAETRLSNNKKKQKDAETWLKTLGGAIPT